MFQVNIPANAEMFYTVVIEMSQFDFFDFDIITDFIFPFLENEPQDEEQEEDRLLLELNQEISLDDADQSAEELVHSKIGKVLLVILLATVLLPVYFLIGHIKSCSRTVLNIWLNLQKFLFWNGTLRYFIESYIEVTITALTWTTLTHTWSTGTGILANLISIA